MPTVIYQKKRYRVCRDENDISEFPEDSTDIFNRNMIDRYIDRPNFRFSSGECAMLDSFCFAEFWRYFYLASGEFKDNHVSKNNYPKQVPLMPSNEKLKFRKVPYVLNYHVPNKHTHPEEHAHHMRFMYFPFRDENELKYSNSYNEKRNLPDALETVNLNHIKVEPYALLLEDASERLATNQESNIDPFGHQENKEVSDRLNEDIQNLKNGELFVDDDMIHANIGLGGNGYTVPLHQNFGISENIRSLNAKQRQLFEVIHKWSRDYMKNLSSKTIKNIKPFHIFLTGGAGVGKSHLIKTIYMSISKVLMYKGGHPEKPRIPLMGPTSVGVAAINIDRTTIHTALEITVGSKLYSLNDRQ